MSKQSFVLITALTLLLITLPYAYAASTAGENLVFNGFLINPTDGNSYMGKMREGWMGSWQFSLFYSGQPSSGSYLFVYYLFLGHIARWTGLSILLVFHAARVIGATVLILVLRQFVDVHLKSSSTHIKTAVFALTCLGSGLGWLAMVFGKITSDLWVAEAYPFLSMLINPHFPLGLALLLDFFNQLDKDIRARSVPWLILKAVFLAIVLPFAMVIAGAVAVGVQIWDFLAKKQPIRWWMLGYLLTCGIFLIYQYLVIQTDPVLAAWNTQNLTPSPPFWDYLVSFSPALVLAIVSSVSAVRARTACEYKLLITWLVVGLALAYFPFQLQRRFLLGFFIPAACLAGIALQTLGNHPQRIVRLSVWALFGFSFVTNLFWLSGSLITSASQSPQLYYPKSLQPAFDWLLKHHQTGDVMISLPTTGNLIPGATGWRVVAGHEYETPNYAAVSLQINKFLSDQSTPDERSALIDEYAVTAIFIGPYEKAYNPNLQWVKSLPVLYQSEEVTIYAAGVSP